MSAMHLRHIGKLLFIFSFYFVVGQAWCDETNDQENINVRDILLNMALLFIVLTEYKGAIDVRIFRDVTAIIEIEAKGEVETHSIRT